jgi:CheY-like chemotaxis protein
VKTILVVDDEPEVRSMMLRILSAHGYGVLEADNGSLALELAGERRPDLIITDVMMDNMNGFMLFELLRKEPATAAIPITLVTGVAQEAGAWDSVENVSYLQKPVDIADLLQAVEQHL